MKRSALTVKDLLGFDIPGAHVEVSDDGMVFSVVKPGMPVGKYAQRVEPKPMTAVELLAMGGKFYSMGDESWCDTATDSYKLDPAKGFVKQ